MIVTSRHRQRSAAGSVMCDVCCAALRRWTRSFTRTETLLSILEAVLLIVFVAFLTFVILHFLACSKKEIDSAGIPSSPGVIDEDSNVPDNSVPEVDGDVTGSEHIAEVGNITESEYISEISNLTGSSYKPEVVDVTGADQTPELFDSTQYTNASGVDDQGKPTTAPGVSDKTQQFDDQGHPTNGTGGKSSPNVSIPTAAPGETCSWKPGEKTQAVTQYFEQSSRTQGTTKIDRDFFENETKSDNTRTSFTSLTRSIIDELLYLSDGEVADLSFKQYVLALVKVRPPQDITFGCILTIVDEYWAVTAASCIEAIEEVDSLDSFVMMEDYGESTHGKTHTVADVMIHPWYEGKNKSFDFVALKSEDSLVKGSKAEVELLSALDYFLLTIGEKFTILGYGGYRTVDQSPSGRRLRWVSTFALSSSQCGTSLGEDAWSPRHLSRPHVSAPGRCGTRVLCAGALNARGSVCNYCAGTPLLSGEKLLGVMSDNPHCGVACEPAVFVNVVLLKPWLDKLFDSDFIA